MLPPSIATINPEGKKKQQYLDKHNHKNKIITALRLHYCIFKNAEEKLSVVIMGHLTVPSYTQSH